MFQCTVYNEGAFYAQEICAFLSCVVPTYFVGETAKKSCENVPKHLTKPMKTKIPKFPEPYHRKQEKQPGILKTMIFEHSWSLSLQVAKPKIMLTLR